MIEETKEARESREIEEVIQKIEKDVKEFLTERYGVSFNSVEFDIDPVDSECEVHVYTKIFGETYCSYYGLDHINEIIDYDCRYRCFIKSIFRSINKRLSKIVFMAREIIMKTEGPALTIIMDEVSVFEKDKLYNYLNITGGYNV